MKTAKFVLIFALALPQMAFSYGIILNGTTFGGLADFSTASPYGAGAFHRDYFYMTNNPGQGESLIGIFGNSGSVGSSILLVPEPGDSPSGTVQVLFHYQFTENLNLTFDNYQPAAFDYHYGCALTVQSSDLLHSDIYNLPAGSTDIVLDLNVGTLESLYFTIDGSAVHDSFNTWSWHPAIINPIIPGFAEPSIVGTLAPISIQVVPEPGSLGLGAVGLILMGARCLKTRRQR